MKFISKGDGLAKYRKPIIRAEKYSHVAMNGELLSFADTNRVSRIATTIQKIHSMERQGLRPSCAEFALLMMGDIYHEYPTNPEEYHLDVKYGDQIEPDHLGDKMVGIFNERDDELAWHVVVPSHTTKGPLYSHKLGYGAMCLSGLSDAMHFYKMYDAFELNQLSVIRTDDRKVMAAYVA